MTRKSISGNALFLVLIAVALFAALSYAITQTSRGGGTTNKEQVVIATAQLNSYLAEIRQAVTRLTLTGCRDTEITFEGNGYVGGDAGPFSGGAVMLPQGSNPNSPSNRSCHVFDKAGGGVAARVIEAANGPYYTGWWSKPGHIWFQMESLAGIGTAAVDLVAVVPDVKPEVCAAFNKSNNVNDGTRLQHTYGHGGAPYHFAGTYTATMMGGVTGTYIPGTTAWCFCDSVNPACASQPNSYNIAFVLLER